MENNSKRGKKEEMSAGTAPASTAADNRNARRYLNQAGQGGSCSRGLPSPALHATHKTFAHKFKTQSKKGRGNKQRGEERGGNAV